MKRSKDKLILLILLLIFLILNVVFLSFYFLKLDPQIKQLKNLQKSIEMTDTVQPSCKRVYSASKGEFICLEYTRPEALSECTTNFKENVYKSALEASETVGDLEKLSNLSIKLCMQEKGFDY